LRKWDVSIPREALEDIAGPRGSTIIELQPIVPAAAGIRFLSEPDQQALRDIGHSPVTWRQRMAERFQGLRVTYQLSRPGFSRDLRRAAVRVESDCGPVCGAGSLVTLRRGPDGRWTVDGTAVLTIA